MSTNTTDDDQYRAELTDWVNAREHSRQWALESYRTSAQFAESAIKAGFLVNGGALVALLAFLGNIAKDGTIDRVTPVGGALVAFIVGLISSAAAAAAAYASVYLKAIAPPTTAPQRVPISSIFTPPATGGAAFHRITVALLLISLIAFLIGSVKAFLALT